MGYLGNIRFRDRLKMVRYNLLNPLGGTMFCYTIDEIVDGGEDAPFALAGIPLGLLLLGSELFIDLASGGYGIARDKIVELKKLRHMHNKVCPEKSNDLFYGLLAVAKRKCEDAYQWVRLKEFEFEINDEHEDMSSPSDTSQNNLFLMPEEDSIKVLGDLNIANTLEQLKEKCGSCGGKCIYYEKFKDTDPLRAYQLRTSSVIPV